MTKGATTVIGAIRYDINRCDTWKGDRVTEGEITNDLCAMSALELRHHYQSRGLSPVEVATATLRRIEQLNPDLNAFITVTSELALTQARAAERAYADGTAGPLAGIPISIKDLTPTRGIRTTRGSLLHTDWIPTDDAPFVERVYAAGAVMLGKTNTPELGWKGDSSNLIVGPTHNPWRHGRTAGGSSGGGAAAVAAGLGPLAQGGDGAGSIRIPCAFCGIFGLKPSFGLVPYAPASVMGDLTHLGPMTRTVRDAALLLNVVAGADPRDRLSWSSDLNYLDGLDSGIRGLRVAWTGDLGYAPVDPAVRTTVEAAAHRFIELSCEVEQIAPPLADPWSIVDAIWSSSMAGLYHRDFDQVRSRIDPGLVEVIEHGGTLSGAEVAEARIRRNDYYEGMRSFMEGYDLLLTPTLPITAFAAGDDQPGTVAGQETSYLSWTPFTFPFNLTGQPAATVPCGLVDGLPVGLQIVGRWHDDATVLRAAAAFEEIAPWPRPALAVAPAPAGVPPTGVPR